MIIAQISDMHVVAEGCLAYGRIDTNGHLQAAITHLNALDPQPDLVLATGDLVNDAEPGEYDCLMRLLGELRAPFAALPGNHDDRAQFRAAFAGAPFVPAGEGPLHWAMDLGPVRLIALDDQVPGEAHGMIGDQTLAWLEARLQERPDHPTILALHHPPVATGIGHMDRMRCFGADGLETLLADYPAVIRILCGHLHRDITAQFAGIPVSICGSTAHSVALTLDDRTAGWRPEPPALLLHVWIEATGLVTHRSPIGDYGEIRRFG